MVDITTFAAEIAKEVGQDMGIAYSETARVLCDYLADHDDPRAVILARALRLMPKCDEPCLFERNRRNYIVCGDGSTVTIMPQSSYSSTRSRVDMRCKARWEITTPRGICTVECLVSESERDALQRSANDQA